MQSTAGCPSGAQSRRTPITFTSTFGVPSCTVAPIGRGATPLIRGTSVPSRSRTTDSECKSSFARSMVLTQPGGGALRIAIVIVVTRQAPGVLSRRGSLSVTRAASATHRSCGATQVATGRMRHTRPDHEAPPGMNGRRAWVRVGDLRAAVRDGGTDRHCTDTCRRRARKGARVIPARRVSPSSAR
jgi:hypothetical protein